MKQKHCGHKVQNWHRPLGPEQLGRWFRRHRLDDVPDDDYWSPYFGDDDWYPEAEDTDLHSFELKQLLREIIHRPQPLFRLEWAIDAALRTEAEPTVTEPEHPIDLEFRLADFLWGITRFPNNPATRNRISDALGEDVYLDVISTAGRLESGHDLVRNVSLFAPFWIRSPRTWNDASLVQHLFVRYEVPSFLWAEWSGEPSIPRLKWLAWFILLAQGGSLRRAAGACNWNIPSRFEYYLRMAPAGLSPIEACTFAEVMRLGGTRTDSRRILSNPAFVVDTTEVAEEDTRSQFWEATVRWVIAHGTVLTDEDCERILAWAMHEYTEAERWSRPPFSWKGRSLQAVLRRSLDYQRQLERPWAAYRWRRHGWDWKPTDPGLDGWSFVELTTGEALFQEGQAMRHCVANYATQCAEGYSAIVSVRYQDARRLTVEVAPATGQLVQAKGPSNRIAGGEELRVIRCWLNTVVQGGSAKASLVSSLLPSLVPAS